MVYSYSTGLLINSIIFCFTNAILLLSIIWITYRTIIEHKKNSQIRTMFFAGLLFNATAFFCIFGSSYQTLSDLSYTNIRMFGDHPILFPCNLVFLQNILLVILLFLRMYYIFHATPFQLSSRIIFGFGLSFIISISVFIILLITQFSIANVHVAVTCALTLCTFNLFFMVSMTLLFLQKLAKIFKQEIKHTCDENGAFIKIITKMTVLSCISMTITFIACVFLLFRDTLLGNNAYAYIVSEWVTTADIYSNFLCFTLTFNFFEHVYQKVCKQVHLKCKNMWYIGLFGSKHVVILNDVLRSKNVNNQTKTETVCSEFQSVQKSTSVVINSENSTTDGKTKTETKTETEIDTQSKKKSQKSNVINPTDIVETPKTPLMQLTDYNSAYKIQKAMSKNKLGSMPESTEQD